MWRDTILNQLKEINLRQNACFVDVFKNYNRLLENIDSMSRYAWKDASSYDTGVIATISPNHPAKNELSEALDTIQCLKQKVFGLQEELTDVHRRRSENTQMVLDLNSELSAKCASLTRISDELMVCKAELQNARQCMDEQSQRYTDLDKCMQLLKDEYQTLQLTLSQTERSLLQVQKERDSLLARLIQFKSDDVDKMNAQNDEFFRRRKERVEKELNEAVEDIVISSGSPSQPASPTFCADLHPVSAGAHSSLISADRRLTAACTSSTATAAVSTAATPLAQLQFTGKFEAHDGEVNGLSWSSNGNHLLTAGTDRKVKLWSNVGSTAQCVHVYTGCTKAVNSVRMSFDDHLVVAASNDATARVWSRVDMRLKYSLTGHSGPVSSAKFHHHDSLLVLSGSRDRTLRMWDLHRGGDCIQTFFSGSICYDVEYLSNMLLSAHFDHTVKVWDTKCSQGPRQQLNVGSAITSLASVSDYQIVCLCKNDSLCLVDFRNSCVLHRFQAEGFRVKSDLCRCSVSTTSEFVAAGSTTGQVFIWNLITYKQEKITQPSVQCSAILSACWHPSYNSLVFSSKTGQIYVWM